MQITPPQAVPKIDLGRPEPPPPPPTTADIQRAVAKADPDAWPASRVDQIKAVQRLLQELKFYSGAIDGLPANNTRSAIREYERLAGIPQPLELGHCLVGAADRGRIEHRDAGAPDRAHATREAALGREAKR